MESDEVERVCEKEEMSNINITKYKRRIKKLI